MSVRTQWREIRRGGAVGATLATLLGLCLLMFPVGSGVRNLSSDLLFAMRPTVIPKEAVLIYMDEESHQTLRQPLDGLWNRAFHADLLQRLQSYGVKAVGFDVLFDLPTTNDVAFVDAIKVQGKVALAIRFTPEPLGGGIPHLKSVHPIEALRHVAACGVVENTDADYVVRRHHWPQHSTNLLSLAWRMAELADYQLPDPFVLRYLNYYGPPRSLPWVRYVDVLSNNVPLTMLSNKVAFVGKYIETTYLGGPGTDTYPTPYSCWRGGRAPGVEINATAFLNLARREWLTELSPGKEFLLILAAGLVFGFGLHFLRPVMIAIGSVGSMLVVFAFAYYFMWEERVWFPWAILSGVQIPVAGICAFVFTAQRVHRENRTLWRQLADLKSLPPPAAAAPQPVAPHAAMGSPPPSRIMRQQLRDLFHGPSPAGLEVPQTVASPANLLLVPDCTLLRRIGVGAYGEVWLGRNVLGTFRAVKIVFRKNFQDDRPYEREFEGIKNFDPLSRSHPGLVHTLHVGRNDQDGYFYYLMELADDASDAPAFDPDQYEAKTLGKELQRRGRLPTGECLQLGLALTDSLGYLHEHGLIHRDIKPSNIIFVEGKPKLADIGLVTQIGEGQTFVGTEGFYPPEGPGSPAGDIYSLGKVLYETVTGFKRDRYPDLPSDMDRAPGNFQAFNRVILKACQTDVRKRYADAREMHADLLALANGKPRKRSFLKRLLTRTPAP